MFAMLIGYVLFHGIRNAREAENDYQQMIINQSTIHYVNFIFEQATTEDVATWCNVATDSIRIFNGTSTL